MARNNISSSQLKVSQLLPPRGIYETVHAKNVEPFNEGYIDYYHVMRNRLI